MRRTYVSFLPFLHLHCNEYKLLEPLWQTVLLRDEPTRLHSLTQAVEKDEQNA